MIAVNSVLSGGQESAEARRQRRIEAFHPSYRRFVRDLSNCACEIEDLAESFPALLFALSTGYGSAPQRDHSFALVCRGATLRRASDALGLPWWLRKLPPQAFTEPLPTFPAEEDYGLRISSLIPRAPGATAAWLKRVAQAQEGAGTDYALWMARQAELASYLEEEFELMAAWAWYSQQPGLLGHRLLRRPWGVEISLKRAREEVAAWRQRLRLSEYLGTGIERPWLADGTASGFQFVALRTIDDFINESTALDNCLDQYADQLNSGQSAIFSIRKGERHVGCVEIGLHGEEVTMPTIVQLRAARNRRAPPEVWQATFAWLGGQRLEPLAPARHAPKAMKRLAARRQLWEPYLGYLEGNGRAQRFRCQVLERLTGRSQRRRRRGAAAIGAPGGIARRQDGKQD
jgi:PcfJ-like protein